MQKQLGIWTKPTATQMLENSVGGNLAPSLGRIRGVRGANGDIFGRASIWKAMCSIPDLEGDVTYTQVAAGETHTVLLRSNGTAVACGDNAEGQCFA